MKVCNTMKVYNMLFDGIFFPISEKERTCYPDQLYKTCPERHLRDQKTNQTKAFTKIWEV